VLCVIEDAHWLDQASAQVLGFVGRRLLAEPVGLVLAARPPVTMPDPLAGLPELLVEGLDARSAGDLLISAGTALIDEDVRARIIDETQGNPLALLEPGARMGAAGFAGGFATLDGASLSIRIEDEYLARLSDLPQDTKQLGLLAAADPAGDVALIRRAATGLHVCIDAADAADAAVEAGLLADGGTLRFRHPLLRSGVYRAASAEERRTAHRALAAATDTVLDPDRRAWHRAYAAAAPDEEVAAELIGSAGRAHARGGAAAAAAFLERAVALTPEPSDRASRALAAAEAKYAVGDLQVQRQTSCRGRNRPVDRNRSSEGRADAWSDRVHAVPRRGCPCSSSQGGHKLSGTRPRSRALDVSPGAHRRRVRRSARRLRCPIAHSPYGTSTPLSQVRLHQHCTCATNLKTKVQALGVFLLAKCRSGPYWR